MHPCCFLSYFSLLILSYLINLNNLRDKNIGLLLKRSLNQRNHNIGSQNNSPALLPKFNSGSFLFNSNNKPILCRYIFFISTAEVLRQRAGMLF